MREANFIDKNRRKWYDIENFEKTDPDEIASDFIDLVGDLSYAKTHYKHSKITSYLNYLAANVYKSIFGRQEKSAIIDFWRLDFPLTVGHHKKVLWLATGLFLLFCVLGYVLSYLDADFIDSVLGSGYVTMTQENIKKGIPFGVYTTDNQLTMFLRIFANNLFVGLLVYMAGIFLGIGTFILTFKNGLMVGCFMAMFFKNQLGFDALFVIMLHGTLELFGLILECMAGLILGLSFLFPNSLSRWDALKKGFFESAKIYIGAIPFTILAAFLESYITHLGKAGLRNTNLSVTILLVVIFAGSWFFIIWYYFIYSKNLEKNITYEQYLKGIIKNYKNK